MPRLKQTEGKYSQRLRRRLIRARNLNTQFIKTVQTKLDDSD